MHVIRLLSTDDTRVIVLTTLELSLNRQIEKYSKNEIMMITRRLCGAYGKRGLASFPHTKGSSYPVVCRPATDRLPGCCFALQGPRAKRARMRASKPARNNRQTFFKNNVCEGALCLN
jgi:hypothetical protein